MLELRRELLEPLVLNERGGYVVPVAQLIIINVVFLINEFDFVDVNKSSKVLFETEISGMPYSWNGNLLRSESKVDQSSQSIFLVAAIENSPSNKKFLVPGVYLKAKIFGKILEGTYSIPRSALYDRNKIFVVNNIFSDIKKFNIESCLHLRRSRVSLQSYYFAILKIRNETESTYLNTTL